MSSPITNSPAAPHSNSEILTVTTEASSSASSADVSSSPSPLSTPSLSHQHHSHHSQSTSESIRKLIASNFNIATSPAQHAGSSSSGNVTPRSRNKSKSISNGVLSHSRTASKKVSFSNFHSINSSQVFTSSSGSSANSSDNDDDYEDEYTIRNDEGLKKSQTTTSPSQPGFRNVQFTMSVTPSPLTISPTISNSTTNTRGAHKNKSGNALRKFASYGGEKLAMSKSLDSQMLEPCDSTSSVSSLLPEFNKRPLTDTPIVSSMASPVTRYQSSEEDDGAPEHSTIHEEDEEAADNVAPLRKTRNISHLNLSELTEAKNNHEEKKLSKTDSDAVEGAAAALASTGAITMPPEFKITNTNFQHTPSASNTPSPSTPTIQMKQEIRDSLLKDVPNEVKEQFEKTPSLEQLKSLLMTKPPPSARKTYTLNIPGQTSSKISPDGKIAQVDVGSKLVIVMVGLPARGKSYITNKLTRYLNWLQHDCRVFNVGNTRRKDKHNAGPEKNPLPDNHTPVNSQSPKEPDHEEAAAEEEEQEHDAAFFSPENKANTALREKWAMDTLDQLLDYVINGTGSVGIFDATNSTNSRRRRVFKRIQERSNGELKVLYLESICNDPNIIESNIRLKLSGPDYKNMDPEVALNDFIGRLHNYEKAYETIDEAEEQIPGFQYVKIIDVGKKIVSYNIQGFLSSQTVYFLLNFNLCERQIWITRHGESRDNLTGRIGGDSHLTKRGDRFARTLAKFMNVKRAEFRKQQLERFSSKLESKYNSMIFNEKDVAMLDSIPTEPNFCVWTSMLIRAIETGQYFNEHLYSVKQMRMLNELGGGKFEGMTYDEIQHKHPREFEARLKDKLSYRYPGVGGESYLDVLTRLRPLITELERTTDHLLIISHRVVLRILLAYFLNLDKSAIGELDVPLHTLYCLESKPYGTDYTMYEYDETLDWFVKSEPDHQKNVKEVGVVFRERKYSVVPTAPPSFRRGGERRPGKHHHNYKEASHSRKPIKE